MPTQVEYNVINQRQRKLFAKINLLNYRFQIVDQWENVVIGDPTFKNDSTSNIRRTCSISLIPTDKSFDVEYGNKIWLDKYIQIYLGIEDVHTREVEYTNMGIYLIENPTRAYSASTNTITIQGIDLMAKFTGLRNGNLEGVTHVIKADTNVRAEIITLLTMAGFDRYVLEECPFAVPNEIRVDAGGTMYDLLTKLRDIAPNYQMYFDVDGVFHYEEIPNGHNEQIMVSDEMWKNTLISYQMNYDFDSVKNSIEVIGKTHDIEYFGNAVVEDNTYVLSIEKVDRLRNNLKIGFVAPSKIENAYININELGSKPIKNESGTDFAELEDEEDVYYVVKYKEDGDYFMYMGEVTPTAKSEDTNADSPFYINGTFGKVRIVLSGGDYDNIFTSASAKRRADWELYTRCKLKDSITLTCIPIYWLDVNWLIEITLPNKQGQEVTNQYIIKSINTTFGVNGTQSISCMRYYPFYAN